MWMILTYEDSWGNIHFHAVTKQIKILSFEWPCIHILCINSHFVGWNWDDQHCRCGWYLHIKKKIAQLNGWWLMYYLSVRVSWSIRLLALHPLRHPWPQLTTFIRSKCNNFQWNNSHPSHKSGIISLQDMANWSVLMKLSVVWIVRVSYEDRPICGN
jgi:hypothetical protein